MGLQAITHRDDGSELVPISNEDWAEWVSATATRNFVLNDPILDWLDLYGEISGFQPDTVSERYDPRTSFIDFLFAKGNEFESAVVALLEQRFTVTRIVDGATNVRDRYFAERTFSAMSVGADILYQGVLIDPEHRTFGAPDLLIKSDVLAELFPDSISVEDAAISAHDLGQNGWHYWVVDIKFHTLRLLAAGEVGNADSAPAYKVQLFLYNQALGRIQGFEPPVSYLIGRGWRQGDDRGTSCMELLGPVTQSGTVVNKYPLGQLASDATEWIRTLRSDGANWVVLPTPTVDQLYPNAGNSEDAPWHTAKRQIIEELQELTQLWRL